MERQAPKRWARLPGYVWTGPSAFGSEAARIARTVEPAGDAFVGLSSESADNETCWSIPTLKQDSEAAPAGLNGEYCGEQSICR
ncbi:hypothetical protein PG985_001242 [Apiospora marii]|uniref:Uncharacterized protein n=1 Tax=Apiospora marii TaxID=335849 RepID=A0ABR1RIC1_9PEZI